MGVPLLTAIDCRSNGTSEDYSAPPAIEFELDRQFSVFFFVNVLALIIYTLFAVMIINKS
jgi:hypothetical protein